MEYSDIPMSRPKTASQNNLADIEFNSSRPKTASWKTKSNSDVSKSDETMQTHGPLRRVISSTDVLRPRSSLRREGSNTHLINGFYQVGLKFEKLRNLIYFSDARNQRTILMNSSTIMVLTTRTPSSLHSGVIFQELISPMHFLSSMAKSTQSKNLPGNKTLLQLA